MINIKGDFAEAKIYTDKLDSGSEGLIKALCNSIIAEGAEIRIMPDVHPGKGCVIGTTIKGLDKRVAPGLVGTDIGCGIIGLEIEPSKATRKLDLNSLDKYIRFTIPHGRQVHSKPLVVSEDARRFINDLACKKHIQEEKSILSLGTLGGGNHFIEMGKSPETGNYWLFVHSGSRHLGVEVENYYHKLAYEYSKDKVPYEFAYLEGEQMYNYFHDVYILQALARFNRRIIAYDICNAIKVEAVSEVDCPHNYISDSDLRKGAISATFGENVIIPLNMRDGVLIGKGLGNADWNYSATHGAGRLYNRSEVSNVATLSQYKKEMKDVFSTCISRDTLDESPMAYKNSEDIIKAIEPTVAVREHVKPIYNFKAGSTD